MKIINYWILVGIITLIAVAVLFRFGLPKPSLTDETNQQPTPTVASKLAIPVDGFWTRITKKPFGIYITPTTSPVQPEKFTGYHTGTDVEFDDVEGEVTIRAIADGKVISARTATGYGGVLVIDHQPEFDWFSLYGHLDPASLPKVGTTVVVGDEIGKLAPAYSSGSGGERKHLHLAIINQKTANIAGYVAEKSQLTGWLDAEKLIPR